LFGLPTTLYLAQEMGEGLGTGKILQRKMSQNKSMILHSYLPIIYFIFSTLSFNSSISFSFLFILILFQLYTFIFELFTSFSSSSFFTLHFYLFAFFFLIILHSSLLSLHFLLPFLPLELSPGVLVFQGFQKGRFLYTF
jgi:hypothetical protein